MDTLDLLLDFFFTPSTDTPLAGVGSCRRIRNGKCIR